MSLMHIHCDRQAETPNQKDNLKAVAGNVYDTHNPLWLEESNMYMNTLGWADRDVKLETKDETVVGK